jgi:hypothetical protein
MVLKDDAKSDMPKIIIEYVRALQGTELAKVIFINCLRHHAG